MTSTSWQPVHTWYDKKLGNDGDWAHAHIVIPKTLLLLSLQEQSSLIDLGCGQGILARFIRPSVSYFGIDIAPSLIDHAKKRDPNRSHRYIVGDITKQIELESTYTHAAAILTIDNIEHPKITFQNVAHVLGLNGIFVFVINHPAFRIPRQSSWEIDETNKIQYRRINRYLTPLKIPISMHPGKVHSPNTWTYHYPISSYSQWLQEAGFVIENIEEWTSDKTSVGSASKMENRSRSEFPLFLAVRARLVKS